MSDFILVVNAFINKYLPDYQLRRLRRLIKNKARYYTFTRISAFKLFNITIPLQRLYTDKFSECTQILAAKTYKKAEQLGVYE